MNNRKRVLGWSTGRGGSACITSAAIAIVIGIVIMVPAPGRTVFADDGFHVVCPSAIEEGETDRMEVRRSGHRVAAATIFTYQGDFTADGSDFVSYNGEYMRNDSGNRALTVPVITNEDTVPEHDETFSIGFWQHGVWHGCVVTITDDDAPAITDLEITSTPASGDTYRAGESIDVTLTLDREVEVSGTPLMSLYVGEDGAPSWRGAQYHSGSGSSYLVFRYNVKAADRDTDGITVSAAEADGEGNVLYGFAGNGEVNARGTDVPIGYTHPAINDAPSHKVDGRPYVRDASITSAPPHGWDAYRANQIVELTMRFDTDVMVEGPVNVGLYVGYDHENWRDAWRPAWYASGSGTDTLVFTYTVRPGDMDAKGIRIARGDSGSGFGGGGTIKAQGTSVEQDRMYAGTWHLSDHKIDTTPPVISAINFASRPENRAAYAAGETVSVRVDCSESVTFQGNPLLVLELGESPRQAAFWPESGQIQRAMERIFTDSITFHCRVQDGDADTDGIGIGANSLRLNGGSIRDSAGNAAGLSHSAVAADSNQRVDTSGGG